MKRRKKENKIEIKIKEKMTNENVEKERSFK